MAPPPGVDTGVALTMVSPGASVMPFRPKLEAGLPAAGVRVPDCAAAGSACTPATPAEARKASNIRRLTQRIVFVVTIGKPQCVHFTHALSPSGLRASVQIYGKWVTFEMKEW